MYADFVVQMEGVNMLSIFCRLSLALICGGIIGLERGSKRRAAGFRTYMLVCVGAALVMLTNQYIHIHFGTSDPARLGAQVVSGIGFLGAGTIIVTRHHQVIGLTTAAGLWASACMGLAIGIGFYEGAIMGSIFIFLIITLMHKVDNKVMSTSKAMEIYIELKEGHVLSDFLSYAHANSIKIAHVELVKPKYEDSKSMAAIISLRLPKRHPHLEVIEEFHTHDFIGFIEEI
ncbi:MgtC/SapB family protein [Ruminococcaceae bacterium OttesenSCG-928-L11]|nr:MgtC/SapB family protein [Ruminococcaceae bacterium OttesenSCG-928-L11]